MEKPGYVVVLAQKLNESSSVTIQYNMAQSADPESWNKELDMLTQVLSRQEARAALPTMRTELKHHELVAEVITDDIRRMNEQAGKIAEAGRDPQRRNQVNTQQIQQNIEAQKSALEKAQRSAEEMRKIIAETEKKAA